MIYFILLSLFVFALGGVYMIVESKRAMVKSLDRIADADIPKKNWPMTKQSSR